jgi:tRNA dimethylallyltransferase
MSSTSSSSLLNKGISPFSNPNDSDASTPLPKVIVLAGPTAVGKSDVAAILCAEGNGVIVSADSVQAYTGVAIGANKPTEAERVATPHLLIDVADCGTSYNAAEWRRDAVACIQALTRPETVTDAARASSNSCNEDEGIDVQVQARRRHIESSIQQARAAHGRAADDPLVPVVVGGTMMYLQWLVYGQPDALRPTEMAIETAKAMISNFQHNNGEDEEDWDGAVTAAAAFGPKFAQQVEKLSGRDWYRLRRILEVALTVQEKGRSSNGNRSEETRERLMGQLYSGQREENLASLGFDVRCFFLCPTDRMMHSKEVDERCEQMIQRGLLEETTDLACTGRLPDMAARAIGYRQTLDYLEKREIPDHDTGSFLEYLKDFTTATRQYSKRQMQWFRRDKNFTFVPVSLDQPKVVRVETAAFEIARLVAMSREDYDKERSQPQGVNETTRRANEAQGKGMRVYQFIRRKLVDNSEALEDVLRRADACRHRFQSKSRKVSQESHG